MNHYERRVEIEYRTEERLGILLQGAPASLKQYFAAKQEAISQVADIELKEHDFGPLRSKIEQIFGSRRWHNTARNA